MIGTAGVRDLVPDAQIDTGGRAFGQEHGDDLAGRAVAEKSAEGLLVELDAVFLDQSDEVGRLIAAQGGSAEMRIVGQESLRRCADIGEVATATAADEDLRARLG